MPTAWAIRSKSGLTPPHALRAFRFYPYCFCQRSSNTHCQAALPSHLQSLPISAAAPVRCKLLRLGSEMPALKKLSMKISVSPDAKAT
ncbi:MAG: hypothetical protein O9311_08225 [Cytophagales bacterium]|nr:hypothetical protein [Cytophagales bacterium]